jgi:hypothetical protein
MMTKISSDSMEAPPLLPAIQTVDRIIDPSPPMSTVPALMQTSSNASESTVDTEIESPASLEPVGFPVSMGPPVLVRSSSESSEVTNSDTSDLPLEIDDGLLNKPSKRTASGQVKVAGTLPYETIRTTSSTPSPRQLKAAEVGPIQSQQLQLATNPPFPLPSSPPTSARA